MIELTKMNGVRFTLNADLIETVEEVPDTVITMTTGKKIFVKESRQNVKNLVKYYKREIYGGFLLKADDEANGGEEPEKASQKPEGTLIT